MPRHEYSLFWECIHKKMLRLHVDVCPGTFDDMQSNMIPIHFNDIVDDIRLSVIEFLVKKKIATLCPFYDSLYEDMQHLVKTNEVTHEEALLEISKNHLEPIPVQEIVYWVNIASTLWRNCYVSMEPRTITKFRVHFPGIHVNQAGLGDIINNGVRTIHTILVIDVVNTFMTCRMVDGNVDFSTPSQPVILGGVPATTTDTLLEYTPTFVAQHHLKTVSQQFKRASPQQFKRQAKKKTKFSKKLYYDSEDDQY